ncbi:hypothetical protein J7E99_05945 [Streptomyces sp. ISL-44]|uniref:hypothetical protein n=1 Tax=Streptomyces sp. ISL-44 TaxID=2819184 RepID=UPI001BEA56FE|nr:hypothetical protein [Streptomyces sp. ISL-44]MBT2540252.1 hypothetical protein [Streptomyces sp. ISL-44]
MAERQQSPGSTYLSLRRWVPPPALTGFLALLVVAFCLPYGVGSAAGPVAPGMHSSGTDAAPKGGDGGSPGRHGHGGAGGTRSGSGR